MGGRRAFAAGPLALGLCGCSGALHRLPQLSQGQLNLAQHEVAWSGPKPVSRAISDEEAIDTVKSVLRRIRPTALELCQEMKAGVCGWQIRLSADRSLNAGAGANGAIVIHKGVVDYAANEEEVALVVAHEMAHQAANHVASTQRNQAIGAMLGAILLGAAAAYGTRGTYGAGDATSSAMRAGADVGGAIGQISFSKEQEREADYLAGVVLYRSGIDLDRARGMLVTMARLSGQKDTGLLDTHPAGPERIASWDEAVREIRARNGALPERSA